MPSITHWNRLEPRTRSEDFDLSLQAQVRDPLWMLTRQWQFGEFKADDAGSAVAVQLTMRHQAFTAFQDVNGRSVDLEGTEIPLETRVEQEAIPMDARTRVQIGQHFERLLRRTDAPVETREVFRQAFPIRNDDRYPATIQDDAGQRFMLAVAGRSIDGGKLLDRIQALAADELVDGQALLAALMPVDRMPPSVLNAHAAIGTAATALLSWYGQTYSQPIEPGHNAWSPRHLEYQFAVSVGAIEEGRLEAAEYTDGSVRWYNFDQSTPLPTSEYVQQTARMLPATVQFKGMPNSRWWAFEDGVADLGSVELDTTDVGHMMVAQFALMANDDWLLVPCRIPTGAVAQVACLIVSDVFGFHTLIRPVRSGGNRPMTQWRLFDIASTSPDVDDERFLLLPRRSGPVLESPPIEEVLLVRDEMANMAWAVEKTLPNVLGEPANVEELIRSTESPQTGHGGAVDSDGHPAALRYRLSTPVARNWVPLMPLHVPGSERDMQLEKVPLIDYGDGDLLPAGMGQILNPPNIARYFINEEEVPRAPRRVQRSWQWTRTPDGRHHLWLGRRKRAGRGQSSGLGFDRIEENPSA